VWSALGVVLAFCRGQERAGEVATGDNRWLNGLQAIDGRGWLRRGINPGVKAGRRYLEVPSGRRTWPKVAEKWRWCEVRRG
jgi:hypothetical protein